MSLWLPKDERRLLAGYAFQMGETGTECRFHEADLTERLSCWWAMKTVPKDGEREEKQCDIAAFTKTVPALMRNMERVKLANKHLAERKLINLERVSLETSVVVVSLTLEGYDLGRRYASSWDCTGIWFEQYKNHWFWLIAACIGGALLKTLFDFIGTLFKGDLPK